MKRFMVTWEYVKTGVSYFNAEDLNEAKIKAPESVNDFDDPKQFKQISQWNEGWDVKSIEEAKR